ncbi:Retrovirus polyprotein [Penicillium bovifimosum]|uniref:Retrovirus polyprotein n=1 Tax=Penicillium bovifimosum TaxID=126998 RepID=A0A9W9HHI7_9EURO|nr:Retrovirus polyprotein [Penicillium bovifimosum]KAJ5145637.1 Retrovirus polyprotein [Penicillium bovifimosum]
MLNGRSFSISALGDTGADGSIFINSALVELLGQHGLRTQRLDRECPVNGLDGKPSRPITHAVILSMGIDGHIQQQIPMLVADLGKHDMIIGRLWFSEHDVLLDCRRRRMIWPHEVSLFEEVASKIALPTPLTILKNPRNLTHQKDADRRDKFLEQSIDPYLDRNGGRFPSPRLHQKGQWRAKDIEKMQRNLDGTKSPELSGTLDIMPADTRDSKRGLCQIQKRKSLQRLLVRSIASLK